MDRIFEALLGKALKRVRKVGNFFHLIRLIESKYGVKSSFLTLRSLFLKKLASFATSFGFVSVLFIVGSMQKA